MGQMSGVLFPTLTGIYFLPQRPNRLWTAHSLLCNEYRFFHRK